MHVFWSKGYEATSLQDLLRAMKLSKSSFYQSYGSKHALFERSINRYRQSVTLEMREKLHQAASGRQFIEEVFSAELDDSKPRWGCFVMNCAGEFAQRDAVIAELVAEGIQQFEVVFLEAIKRAQREGDIASDRDARALARYLVSSRSGLKTMIMAGVEPGTLRDIVALVYATLGWT